jgi:hypothetical protein
MIITGNRLVHFGKIADISILYQPIENLLLKLKRLISCEKLILLKSHQPSIVFFTATNGGFHPATMHQLPVETGSLDEVVILSGQKPGRQAKFVKCFTISLSLMI